ncbi:MAG: glycosyltransferase, partial [Sciscionella sp.]
VLLLPSRDEGLPTAILEAMAFGLVPVVSPVGSIPEVITDGVNGLLVPVGDHAALGAAVRKLIEDPALLTALGVAARATAESMSESNYAARLAGLWRDLAQRADRAA